MLDRRLCLIDACLILVASFSILQVHASHSHTQTKHTTQYRQLHRSRSNRVQSTDYRAHMTHGVIRSCSFWILVSEAAAHPRPALSALCLWRPPRRVAGSRPRPTAQATHTGPHTVSVAVSVTASHHRHITSTRRRSCSFWLRASPPAPRSARVLILPRRYRPASSRPRASARPPTGRAPGSGHSPYGAAASPRAPGQRGRSGRPHVTAEPQARRRQTPSPPLPSPRARQHQ